MYVQKLFNPANNAEIIRHAHPTLQKAIDCAQKIERKFLLIDVIQQTEYDTVMSSGANANNNLMRLQRLANITCDKYRKVIIGRSGLTLLTIIQGQIKTCKCSLTALQQQEYKP